MTFGEIQQEIIDIRFKETQRVSIRRWINLRSQGLWAFADWPWKRLGPVDLTVEVGVDNPVPPDDFLRPIRIYDDLGSELVWMEPDEFDTAYRYTQLNNVRGRPDAFRWVDNVLTLGIRPNSDYTYSIIYERKHAFLQGGTTPVSGLMSADADTPIWDPDYHYILVIGAMATGLRMENDPTYPQIEEEYNGLLNSMMDYYLPTASPAGHMQYGADWDLY